MISVTHCEQKWLAVFFGTVFKQLLKGTLYGSPVFYVIAFDMSAAHVKVGIIQKLVFSRTDMRLDNTAFFVVDQQQNMRKLERTIFSDFYSGRYTFYYGTFGSSDKSFIFGFKAILREVDNHHKSVTLIAVSGSSFYQDKTVIYRTEKIFSEIIVHIVDYLGDTLLWLVRKIAFGVDKIKRTGFVAYKSGEFFPISGLRSKLIACHYAPFFHVDAFFRQQHFVEFNG